MLFNKTYQSLMKSIMEEREWDEPVYKPGYDEGFYDYEADELEVGDDTYWVNATIHYITHPEGVDIGSEGIELTELYKYDPVKDDNVKINLQSIPKELEEIIVSRVEEDFFENKIDNL